MLRSSKIPVLWERNFRIPSASRSCFLLNLKIPRSILPWQHLKNFGLCSVDACSKLGAKFRWDLIFTEIPPSSPPPVQLWLAAWGGNFTYNWSSVNSGHWDQSQHFTVSLKVGSHEVSVPLRGLQQPHWSQMKKHTFESDPLSSGLYGEKASQTCVGEASHFTSILC